MQVLPNLNAPFVDKDGKLLPPWNSYLQQFTNAPAPVIDISVGSSPFNYQAVEPGYIHRSGAISAAFLVRGDVLLNVSTLILIPLSINDTYSLTFGVAPTLKFIPSYGAVPR